MARGAEAKQAVFAKIKEIFPEAFMDDKVMRIPMAENGEVVEIKVALTAAKDVIGGGIGAAIAQADPGRIDFTDNMPAVGNTVKISTPTEITAEEKANVEKLVKALGL